MTIKSPHGWLEIWGKHCVIWIEPRPHYCDRGNFIAYIDSNGEPGAALALSLDWADGWPRYYFDEERMKLEILAWLHKRGEFINDTFEEKQIRG